jgi:hypothetical protein
VRRKKAEGTGGRTGHFGKDYNKIYVEVAAWENKLYPVLTSSRIIYSCRNRCNRENYSQTTYWYYVIKGILHLSSNFVILRNYKQNIYIIGSSIADDTVHDSYFFILNFCKQINCVGLTFFSVSYRLL